MATIERFATLKKPKDIDRLKIRPHKLKPQAWLFLSDNKEANAKALGEIPARNKIIRVLEDIGRETNTQSKHESQVAKSLVNELKQLKENIDSEPQPPSKQTCSENHSYEEIASMLANSCRNHVRAKLEDYEQQSIEMKTPDLFSMIPLFHPPLMGNGTAGATDISMCVKAAEQIRLFSSGSTNRKSHSTTTTSAMDWESVFTLLYAALVVYDQKEVQRIESTAEHAKVIILKGSSKDQASLVKRLRKHLTDLNREVAEKGNFWSLEDNGDAVNLVLRRHLVSRS
jgi:hypothetical protein